ncbi:MAG: cell wall metabolism sensor histidine kinase WalK [Oscillospiraceae bacterium]|jgi:two-component system sensor histidine kinase VicK|nr:cell wall metabolism sensor histidine kinase WalK [Oscillospiraceae bacterium]
MLKSLYRKLVLILLLLIVSLMAVTGVFLNGAVANYFIDEFNGTMREAFSENIGFVRALREAAAGEDAIPQLWDVLQASHGIMGVSGSRPVYLLDGRTGALLEPADTDETIGLPPNIVTAMSGRIGLEQRMGDSFFDCAVPITDGEGAFDYIVYVRDSKKGFTEQSRSMFFVILQAVILGLTFSLLLSLLLSKTMTTPIENLTRGAARVAAGDFSEKIEVHSRDEIGTLTQTFNYMAGVLQKSLRDVEGERDKLSTLFLHMTDGVAAFAHDGELLHVNLAALRLLSLRDADTLTYEAFERYVPFEDAATLRPPDYLTSDMRVGSRVLRLYVAPFGHGGAESGLMAVLHDVTEQNRLEDLRREFVSNVSHELRTPLTGIKSYAETLMEPEGLTHEEIMRFSAVIVDEADRMARLVRDLLTLSRFDYGKAEWHAADFDISELLRRIYDLLRVEAKTYRHKLSLSVGKLPEAIYGDRDQIEQVLINIVANAIRYTPEEGNIAIEADSDRDFVTIAVRDNGIGIPEEDLPYVFDRFYRVDKARSRAQGGTGLGLAIAREIIDSHGGGLDIWSKQGKGTTVTLTLPRGGVKLP